MKFSKLSQLALVSAIGLLVATLLTACQLVTVDYVFVAASAGTSAGSAGQIYSYAVDAQSGAIRSALPVVSSGGTNPVAMATTSDYSNLYVANQGGSTVIHFTIADDGTLTKKDSVTLPTTPVSIAVNTANTYLYVVSYAPSSAANTATLTEYALSSGAIGSAVDTVNLSLNCTGSSIAYHPGDVIVPTGVTVLANNGAVYVAAYDASAYNASGGATTSNANPGWVFGLKAGSGGTLSPAANNCANTGTTYQSYDVYEAGVKPSAIANDPTSRFLYVTDYASNGLVGYTVLSSEALNFMVNGPFVTGREPTAVIVDPRGLYLYVTNAEDNTVSAYSITLSTGAPSAVVDITSASNKTDTDPVSLVVEPSLGRFVYTANFLGNSISGFKLNADTGALSATQATPYPIGGANPAAVIAVPHGNHATESVAP
jgi:6-phosphogluconolactonase (cycloisomerase 2 family)